MGRLEQAGRNARQIDMSGLLLTSDTSVLLVKMLKYIINNLINIYQNTRKYMEDLMKYGRISMGPDMARPRWFSLDIDHFHFMASRRSRSAARASQGEGPEKSAMSRLRERLAPRCPKPSVVIGDPSKDGVVPECS